MDGVSGILSGGESHKDHQQIAKYLRQLLNSQLVNKMVPYSTIRPIFVSLIQMGLSYECLYSLAKLRYWHMID